MRWLIEKDLLWVAGAALISTTSAVFAYWQRIGDLLGEETDLVIVSIVLGTTCSVGLFSWLFLHRVAARNRIVAGIVFGFGGVITAHLFAAIISSVLLLLAGHESFTLWSFVSWVFGIAVIGMFILNGLSIAWGIFLGGTIAWLYDFTHPTPATELPMPDKP